jgi:hypothetical protein
MQGRWLVAAASVVALSGAPARAHAQTQFFDNYCVTTSFNVCASVRVFTSGNTLTMQIWNLNGSMGAAHTITSVGLYHLGSASNWSGTIQGFSAAWTQQDGTTTDVSAYWRPKWANDIKTLAAENIELAQGTSGTKGGIVGCTDPGGQLHFATCTNPGGNNSFPGNPVLTFSFTLSQPFALGSNVGLRWHSQQLPDGSSTKCDTGIGQNLNYGPCQGVVTPEPVTIALLGSGLASMGGMGFLRRRRKTPIGEV